MWKDWLLKFVHDFTGLEKDMEIIQEETVKLAVTARSKNADKGTV